MNIEGAGEMAVQVLSAGFFSLSDIRRGASLLDLNLPRPSAAASTFFFTCPASSSFQDLPLAAKPSQHQQSSTTFSAAAHSSCGHSVPRCIRLRSGTVLATLLTSCTTSSSSRPCDNPHLQCMWAMLGNTAAIQLIHVHSVGSKFLMMVGSKSLVNTIAHYGKLGPELAERSCTLVTSAGNALS